MAKKTIPPVPATNGAFIKFQSYDHIFIPADKASAFFACLEGAYIMSQDYKDGEYVYSLKDKQGIDVELVQGYEVLNAIASKKLGV